MGRLFGTDGVRGTYGEDLTDSLARSLGRAAAIVLGLGHPRPRLLIGRDTRASGEALERALVSGIGAAGGEALLAGVVPTPAVAHLVRSYGAAAGAVISASHNPARDNGIKFFGPDGMKLPDAVEGAIEAIVEDSPDDPRPAEPVVLGDAEDRYLSFLLDGAAPLAGLRIVVDCANGAAYRVAPEAYRRAGAEVVAVGEEPDGDNINDGCGSTYPERLQAMVVARGAAAGIAHDGDADRVIAIDERGGIVDGDQILAICALDALARGTLPGPAVVGTVMANLGFRRAMGRAGIGVVETAVGDRAVLEAMRERGIALGGEQSGHIIFLDRHTTGDGILTALRLLGILRASGRTLSELAAVCPRMPQVLVAVRVRDRGRLPKVRAVWDEVRRVEAELGEAGRVVVRPSGTEPVVRVMVEAATEEGARACAERIATVVAGALG
ncbi:MAG: phosphoglucosamine mutase [Acidobacteria bacterium]|nr:phosphoglucosamine mutase [Acidobacteriota bacterium]